jgi:amino acid transporter
MALALAEDWNLAQQLDAQAPMEVAGEHGASPGRRLGAFLCWAVVFADIGTSVYYVPGILYGDPKQGIGVGDLAGLFVIMTLVVFLLLTLKYAEVSVRFPEGGGVVTVSARGINPWAGAVGGMFILVDYFLTAAISSLSGVQYFETLVPALGNIVVQLVITLSLLGFLGVLNWYGIKESAAVSMVIALAALFSDVLILVLVVVQVPPNVMAQVFQLMFSGHNLTVPLVLTGYAGAFLAFSGLESISQLSPVMQLPRNRTVTRALALVVITVGITGPLLTIFSTTLLTHPELLRQTGLAAPNITSLPNLESQFISQLGYSAGGRLLEVLTAVTASTLLLFASNTAIIGGYHVLIALSKMQFFPAIVEHRNRLRGTPHIAILLVTVIPMAVLILVGGQIVILGDMYAFGLLGAFSLTCISLDVIRWRERHGEQPVVTLDEHEHEAVPVAATRSAPARAVSGRVPSIPLAESLSAMRMRVSTTRAAVGRAAAPAVIQIRGLWPDIRYYLGLLTTVLVGSAWLINLRTKPLATVFGGGLTLIGVGISVAHFRYQQQRGLEFIQPVYYLRPMPRSRLAVLDPLSPHNAAVVRAACQEAPGHELLFLCLGRPQIPVVRTFAITDAYSHDPAAQATLRLAARICRAEGVAATYLYRVARPNAVLDAWRVIQPDEIIAEASVAKEFAQKVTPDYVRLQQLEGVKVVHAIRRRISTLEEQPPSAQVTGERAPAGMRKTPGPAISGSRQIPEGERRKPERAEMPAEAAAAEPAQEIGERAPRGAGEEPQPRVRRPVTRAGTGAPPAAKREAPEAAEAMGPSAPAERGEARRPTQGEGAAEEAPGEAEAAQRPPQTGPLPPNVDLDQYVWTGTDLVRREELEQKGRETSPENDDDHHAPDEPGPSHTG